MMLNDQFESGGRKFRKGFLFVSMCVISTAFGLTVLYLAVKVVKLAWYG
jgi:hypothetical protein